MIKIKALHVEQFRGIRKFDLLINGDNVAIKGPNGSGKSGVIDAIEFGLTGNITRLTGMGTGGVNVKSHGPHVDSKDSPDKAKVTLELVLPSGTNFTLTRTVAAPAKPILSPQTDETKAAVAYISAHPEFSLSRREILKFVLTEAGKRAKEVQSLLKLDAIEKNRGVFQTASNAASRDEKTADSAFKQAQTGLLTHLKISDLTKELILKAVNERRTLLGLSTFNDLTADIKFSDGITSDPKDPKKSIPRTDSITRAAEIISLLDGSVPKNSEKIKLGIEAVEKLKSQPALLSSLSRQTLFVSGFPLVLDESCPLCDLTWEREKLLAHLKEKIAKNKEASELKTTIETAVSERVNAVLRSLSNAFDDFTKYATALDLTTEAKAILDAATDLRALEKNYNRTIEDLNSTEDLLRTPTKLIPKEILDIFKKLKGELEKLPDTSSEEAAKQYLVLADERIATYRKTKNEHDLNKKREAALGAILKHFTEVSEAKLTDLYNDVQADFAKYYRELNKEDENTFTAFLKQENGGLNFEVDFYGRGQFPPNAYHSEGHQDSMGLCLYFALTKRILGNSFSLCLLDDVLMSVDSSHRREVCKLLKEEFPNTQFVMTTHDDVWSKQLTLEGVVKGKNLLQFRKWSVDDGPAAWDLGEVWKEIESDIQNNKIPAASQSLRRYLEFLLTELAYKLRADLEARPTSSYDLGELMPAVSSKFKSLLSKAKKAANSWDQKEIVERLSAIDRTFGQKYAATNAEQWAVNAAVHYNEWANLQANDFKNVLKCFSELIDILKCGTCTGWLYATPAKGSPEALRCDCGQTSYNFKEKP